MAIRSRDFVGIAERIKSQEETTSQKVERLEQKKDTLGSKISSLGSRIRSLKAQLEAEMYSEDDEDGPDTNLIESLIDQIRDASSELESTKEENHKTSAELTDTKIELNAIEEEKRQTLFEIQERARTTSNNISVAGGMFGAYSGVGGKLQGSLSTSYDALFQAARILGSDIGSAGGGGGTGGSGSSGSRSSVSGSIGSSNSSGASPIAALTGGGSNGVSHVSPSKFSRRRSRGSSGSSGSNQGKKSGSMASPETFESHQKPDSVVNDSFKSGTAENNALSPESKPNTFTSKKMSSGFSGDVFSDPSNSIKKTTPGINSGQSGSARSDTSYTGFKNDISNSGVDNSKSYITRVGRNEFIDSLIVQDWEQGKYSDYSAALERRRAAQDSFKNFQDSPNNYSYISNSGKTPVVYADPATIMGIKGTDDKGFWDYKSTKMEDYVEMANAIPKVYDLAKQGDKLLDLAKRNDIIGACTRNYFLDESLAAHKIGNSFLFDGDGRHRVMAAAIAGVMMPIRVLGEYKIKTKTVIKPSDVFSELKWHDFDQNIESSNYHNQIHYSEIGSETFVVRKNIFERAKSIAKQIKNKNSKDIDSLIDGYKNVDSQNLDQETGRELAVIASRIIKFEYGEDAPVEILNRLAKNVQILDKDDLKKYYPYANPDKAAFFSEETEKVVIIKGTTTKETYLSLIKTFVHEMIHGISYKDLQMGLMESYELLGLNEGVTELYAIRAMESLDSIDKIFNRKYRDEVDIVETLESICGKQVLKDAFLNQQVTPLKQDFNECVGRNNAWKDFYRSVQRLHILKYDSKELFNNEIPSSEKINQIKTYYKNKVYELLNEYRTGKEQQSKLKNDNPFTRSLKVKTGSNRPNITKSQNKSTATESDERERELADELER